MNETRSSAPGEFVTYLSVEVASGSESRVVGGTLFGKSSPRLVMTDGFHLEVEPAGSMLFIRNSDVPGVIGEVGRILGEKGVNIANMFNGRREAGGEALTVVCVDGDPGEDVVEVLGAATSVLAVKLVRAS